VGVRADGLVLAGGGGVRFGRPKATVVLDGQTLVERAVAALEPRCRKVVVVGRPEVALPVPSVDDRPGPDCPLNALATGLAAVDGDEVLVLACDLPGAAPVLDRLLLAPSVAVDPDGRAQPLCARYPRLAALAAADRLLAAGQLRLLALLDELAPSLVAASAAELHNITTRADLEASQSLRGDR
jgi:molybdopterin-guanine dinucleotide biosynthesis protein A